MQLLGLFRPLLTRFARDLPLLPGLLQQPVQLRAQRFQRLLPLLPDHVDLGVVGDGFQRDVRHAVIDKAVADVAMHGLAARRRARDFSLLQLTFTRISQQVVGIARTHYAGAGQGKCDARRVDGDPAAPPLFGDGGRGAGTAGRVKD
ncbi:hypothetical protein D9M68_646580 [compost metagenome]